VLCVGAAVIALTPAGASAGGGKAELKAPVKSQASFVAKGRIPVKANGLDKVTKVVARSKTFDSSKFRKLSKPLFLKPGSDGGNLKLTAKGLRRIQSCQPRKIKLQADGAKDARFKLV